MSEFMVDEHYNQSMEMTDGHGCQEVVRIRTGHWHMLHIPGYVASVFMIDHGCMHLQVSVTPEQCRDLAAKLLVHADEVEIHQLQVKPLAVAA